MRPFRQSEQVRNVWNDALGITSSPVAPCSDPACDCTTKPDAIHVTWQVGSTSSIHVDCLEHVQLFADGRILRNGNGWFELVGAAPDARRYGSLADAITALRGPLQVGEEILDSGNAAV
jgi:hypothetical protein